jgi:uncharacterized protein DUF6265
LWLLPRRGLGQTPPPSIVVCEQPASPLVTGPLVQDLAFMSGSWQRGVAGGIFDEEWSSPRADKMMGMFRYMENDKVTFHEFMVIEAGATGRHFDPDLAAWEERSKLLSFSVGSFTNNQVIYREHRHDHSSDLPAKLLQVPHRGSREGSQGHHGTQEFHYTRVK